MVIKWDFIIFLVVSLLFLPIDFVINWLLAATLHEISHIIMLYILRIRIFQIQLKATGTYMETEPMTPKQEMLCALAGPLGGFMGVILYRVNPYFAICSFLQSVFNLVPIYPTDGGRVLYSLLRLKLNEHAANVVLDLICFIIILTVILVGYLLMIRNGYSLGTMHIVSCVFAVTLLKNSLQRCRKNSTM